LISLQHPNIVTCQALEHTSTGRCLVMDYCEGGTLRSLMSEDNPLRLAYGIKLVADILAGLEHAHNRDIVHCDIKPENILLSVAPTGWIARISDFGVARLSQELISQEFGNTGSPAYMAPERFYGQYSRTSDLYSVGILLFELVVGHRPFSGTPAALMSAHLNQPVKIPETVPEVWRPLMITALQKLSARRFQSAGEMLSMLRSIATTEEAGVEPNSFAASGLCSGSLFQPVVTLPSAPFRSQYQEALQQPLTALAAQPLQQGLEGVAKAQSSSNSAASRFLLYRSTSDQVAWCEYERNGLGEMHQADSQSLNENCPTFEWNQVSCTGPIRALFPRPQGCFVVAQRSLDLILHPAKSEVSVMSSTTGASRFTSHPVLVMEQDYRLAIDDRGRWLATFTVDSTETGVLKFWHLHPVVAPRVSHSVTVNLAHLASQSLDSVQLIALDAHHVALVLDLDTQHPNKPDQHSSGSTIQILTRRGTQVGTLHLPVRIDQVTQTLFPYRLLAIDRQNPGSILLMDLKPFRISRLGVEIEPSFLMPTTWGCIAASAEGRMTCLDREGRPIGKLIAPEPITAIMTIEPYSMLISTWNGQKGDLHALDWRQSNLDLLF